MGKHLVTDPGAIAAWVERHRRALSGRGLWLRGGEPNTLDPAGFGAARLRVLIVRLSEYGEVATGLTHSLLFQLAAGVDGVYVDLAFLPSARDESLMRRDGIPLLVGTGSKQPASAFDLLAVSNSVVQELINLPALLAHSGIPLSREGRAAGRFPFVLLGGSNSYVTSVLHGPIGWSGEDSGDGLVDGVVVGDGEEAFPRFLALARDLAGQGRASLLAAARRDVPGFYDPSAYRQEFDGAGRLARIVPAAGAPFPVRAHRADPEAPKNYFVRGPIFYHEEAAGTAPLLVTSGCPYFCSFCKESWEQKPYRERPVAALIDAARQMKANLGLSEIGLMTFNLNTCSGLRPLLAELDRLFDRVALKSQRFDAIAYAPDLLERQLAAGKRTYTCAMEGISDRLRERLQKNLPEAVLLKGFQELFQRQVRQMKIFVIVTGWEVESDLQEFGRLLDRLKKLMEGRRGRPLLTFSLAALFRPPRTPLQAMARPGGMAQLEHLMQQVLTAVRQAGFEGRISAGPADAIVSEWLAYADRRGTARLVEASVARGFRYRGECGADLAAFLTTDSPTPTGPEGYLSQAVARSDLEGGPSRASERRASARGAGAENPEHAMVAGIARDDGRFRHGGVLYPWDDVDVGVKTEFLARNIAVLEQGGSLPSCLARPFGEGVCLGCGACRTEVERQATLQWSSQDEGPGMAARAGSRATPTGPGSARARGGAARAEPVLRRWRVVASLPRRWAETGHRFLGAVLARNLMRGLPGLVETFVRVERSMERQASYGLFWADILVKAEWCGPAPAARVGNVAPGAVFPLKGEDADGMVILEMRLVPGRVDVPGDEPGYQLRLELPSEVIDPAPRVDEVLHRYRWAHQKRWIGDCLTWLLHPGQAKKSGLVRLEWRRGAGRLELEVLRWPEPHVLPALSGGDGLCEVLAFIPKPAL